MTALPNLFVGRSPRARAVRWAAWVLLAIAVFAGLCGIYRQNPWTAVRTMWDGTVGSTFGWQQILTGMIPLLFCALAVTIPARIGQVNVGGEGQLWIGGLCAAGVGLWFEGLPSWLLLTLMAVAGAGGGAIFAGIPGWLKARGWMNEVFSTVLLNYVGILAVVFLVLGPWHDPFSGNQPQTRLLTTRAWLPVFGDSGVDVTIIVAVLAIVALDVVLRRTRWGLEIRSIGGNPNAAARLGVPVPTFIIATMCIGGALAGFAGMAQLAAVQHQLNESLSPPAGFGYFGFLVSWLAGHNPRLLIPMAFLVSTFTVASIPLQLDLGLPPEIVNVLAGLVMLIVLVGRSVESRQAWT